MKAAERNRAMATSSHDRRRVTRRGRATLIRVRRQVAEPETFHQRIDAPGGFALAQALLKGSGLLHLLGQHLEVRSLSACHRFPARGGIRARRELLALLLFLSLLLLW